MWRFSQLKAFLFDLDGVVVESNLDLFAIKKELFGKQVPILESIEKLPVEKRFWARNRLKKMELDAVESSTLREGIKQIISYVREKGLKWGIVTRNCWDTVERIKDKFSLDWDVAVSREMSEPKPSPAAVVSACELVDVSPKDVVMIGDFEYDVLSGARAGARTVFIRSSKCPTSCNADLIVSDLQELYGILLKDPCLSQREFSGFLTPEEERVLWKSSVAIVEPDGYGSMVAEILVRMGIGNLIIVGDGGSICSGDCDAFSETVGFLRKDILEQRLLSINPLVNVVFMDDGYTDVVNYVVEGFYSGKHNVIEFEDAAVNTARKVVTELLKRNGLV
ncbi:MAG: HAD-IA family hydrolase [Synergistetes bacterium]|nr:HAD-IA family hydrolase [Synergistota bacterium]